MRSALLLLLLFQLTQALVINSLSGQVKNSDPKESEKRFFHDGDTIASGTQISTGGTVVALLHHNEQDVILLPNSEYSLYFDDTLLQITLHKGELYGFDRQGLTTVNSGKTTVTLRGSAALSRVANTIEVISITGGVTMFNESSRSGEFIKKGYAVSFVDSTYKRRFYKPEELRPLCTVLPCSLKTMLFCETCEEERERFVDTTYIELLSGELYLHPFTIEADNSFPIPPDEFPKGISETELFRQVTFTKLEKKGYGLFAKREQEGRTDYYVLDGIITPDRNNPNRVMATLTLYSGEENAVVKTVKLSLFLLDDFSTGGKIIDPAFFEAAAKIVVAELKE